MANFGFFAITHILQCRLGTTGQVQITSLALCLHARTQLGGVLTLHEKNCKPYKCSPYISP